MKVGATVISSRRAGNTFTFAELNKYFTISKMPVASGRYWNDVHGGNKEEVLQDHEGLQNMRFLADNMVFLMKAIQASKNELKPHDEDMIYTNCIRKEK